MCILLRSQNFAPPVSSHRLKIRRWGSCTKHLLSLIVHKWMFGHFELSYINGQAFILSYDNIVHPIEIPRVSNSPVLLRIFPFIVFYCFYFFLNKRLCEINFNLEKLQISIMFHNRNCVFLNCKLSDSGNVFFIFFRVIFIFCVFLKICKISQ